MVVVPKESNKINAALFDVGCRLLYDDIENFYDESGTFMIIRDLKHDHFNIEQKIIKSLRETFPKYNFSLFKDFKKLDLNSNIVVAMIKYQKRTLQEEYEKYLIYILNNIRQFEIQELEKIKQVYEFQYYKK